MEPEDKDNFRDDDGCPDPDNDGDGVRDEDDKCPLLAEDIDMFEDTDGCPEFDNDKDGVPDSSDNCMNEPEVYNGYKDDDGCPDTLIKPTEKETVKLNTKLRSINFKTGSAQLISSSFAALDYIVRYEIQGHTDSQGADETNLLLSAARANTVRDYLLSRNVPDSSLIAIGYGETVPIADNNTANGRALNRRVQFRIVETNDEYNALKTNETLFQEKIRAAKIKGYR
jgi:outer membrane protein OmpA-like peptidoglycan-associated protein